MKKILISPSFTKESQKLITEELSDFQVELLKTPHEKDADVCALIIRSQTQVNEKLLKTFSQVKAVVSATSGFDHFEEATVLKKQNDIHFGYTPEANSTSAAELTFFHILQTFKKSQSHDKSKRDATLLGNEVYGKQLCIVGLGRIGKKVAHFAQAFSMKVTAYDPYITHNWEGIRFYERLEEGLKDCDVLSLHCPLTPITKGLINTETLSYLSPSATLINCARGGLVIEKDLLQAIENKKLSAAALDVNETEPLSESSPLRQLENVYLSPHLGAYTQEAHKKSALEACKQVKETLKDSRLKSSKSALTPLPYDKLWYQKSRPFAY